MSSSYLELEQFNMCLQDTRKARVDKYHSGFTDYQYARINDDFLHELIMYPKHSCKCNSDNPTITCNCKKLDVTYFTLYKCVNKDCKNL